MNFKLSILFLFLTFNLVGQEVTYQPKVENDSVSVLVTDWRSSPPTYQMYDGMTVDQGTNFFNDINARIYNEMARMDYQKILLQRQLMASTFAKQKIDSTSNYFQTVAEVMAGKMDGLWSYTPDVNKKATEVLIAGFGMTMKESKVELGEMFFHSPRRMVITFATAGTVLMSSLDGNVWLGMDGSGKIHLLTKLQEPESEND